MIESLRRAALGADPIPGTALTLAVHRARLDILTDKPLRSERIGLIKAYHRRKGDKHVSASLNPEHPSPAYHCGRLLAVLANLHRPARLPQRKKT